MGKSFEVGGSTGGFRGLLASILVLGFKADFVFEMGFLMAVLTLLVIILALRVNIVAPVFQLNMIFLFHLLLILPVDGPLIYKSKSNLF